MYKPRETVRGHDSTPSASAAHAESYYDPTSSSSVTNSESHDPIPSPSATNADKKRKHLGTLDQMEILRPEEPWDSDGVEISPIFHLFQSVAKKNKPQI